MTNIISVNCINFEIGPATRAQIIRSAEKLLQHRLPITKVRLNLEGVYDQLTKIYYQVRIIVETQNSEIILVEKSDQLLPGVQNVIDRTEQVIRQRENVELEMRHFAGEVR